MRAETRWGTLMILAAGTLALAGCDGPPPAIAERAGAGGHTAEVVALAYTPDGTMLVSRGADAVRVWDAATLVERQKLPSDGAEFGGLAINPDGRTMATTRAGRGIDLWIVPDRSWTVSNIAVDPAAAVAPPGTFGWGLAFAPDGTTLAGPAPEAGANPAIQFWKVTRGEEAGATTTELVPTGVGLPGSPATHLAYTPDGKTLIAKSMEGQIRVWDVARQAERATIDANLSYLAAIGVSPDGATVASSGADRYLRFWSVATGKEVAKLQGHLKAILGVAFHPDGRHVVTGDSGGTIFLWDIPSRRVIAQFKGHQGKVWALAFRPDGKELASAGQDRRIRLWDAARALATYGQ